MSVAEMPPQARRLAQAPPVWRAQVDAAGWLAAARDAADAGGRLVALWASAAAGRPQAVHAALAADRGLLWMTLSLDAGASYPDLVPHFACAARMQRAAADLTGAEAAGAADRRPWLDHGLWGAGVRPLAAPPRDEAAAAATPPAYAFVRVAGDGVHEIAVGPVHAGVIEPGHFRFSVVGEKVLRLEEQLGYTHRGVEHTFAATPALQAYRLAARVSGDSAVAFSWAYCAALETATATAVPLRAAWLRALMLERERIANHLGDLGALGNDAGLAFGLAQFARLREAWQRLQLQLFGHRLLMDAVVPGGVAVDLDADGVESIIAQCTSIEHEVGVLRRIYDEHAGLQDRFMSTGRCPRELALRLGVTGLAGRACGIARDLRADHPVAPYDSAGVRACVRDTGDVAARVQVRFDELSASLGLVRRFARGLPPGELAAPVQVHAAAGAEGVGWIEGWRGEVLVALELGAAGAIARCHPHDPSWQNWPALEHAVIGNIVPDFPLINKSFNLSYAGHDL